MAVNGAYRISAAAARSPFACAQVMRAPEMGNPTMRFSWSLALDSSDRVSAARSGSFAIDHLPEELLLDRHHRMGVEHPVLVADLFA
jgi:hypothetical protein